MISAGRKWVETAQSGLLPLEEADEPRGVQLVEGQPEALVLPGLVEVVVEPAEHLGRAVDQVEVGLGVDPPEELARVLEDVDVADLAHPAGGDQGALERLGRADVAGAGGGGEDEDAVERGAGRRGRLRLVGPRFPREP